MTDAADVAPEHERCLKNLAADNVRTLCIPKVARHPAKGFRTLRNWNYHEYRRNHRLPVNHRRSDTSCTLSSSTYQPLARCIPPPHRDYRRHRHN